MVTVDQIDGPSDPVGAPWPRRPEQGIGTESGRKGPKATSGDARGGLRRRAAGPKPQSGGTVGAESRHNGEVPDVSGPDLQAPDLGGSDEDAPDAGSSGTSDEVRAQREAELRSLIELMRPAVQADGGDLELVSFDVDSGVVEVQLQGACSSCAISSATLQGGVERILRGRLDWVTEVFGGVDESADPFDSAALGRGAYVPRA
jgi:Fe-S cluster biogenesis protein NfuA